jgi:integrase
MKLATVMDGPKTIATPDKKSPLGPMVGDQRYTGRSRRRRGQDASQLIDAGVDIVTISKRLGHSKPDITLRVYAHLFRNDDSKAAAAINAAFR